MLFKPSSGGSSAVSSGSKNYLAAVTTTGGLNTGNGDFELNATTGWSLAHSSLTSAFPSTVGTAANSFSSAGGAHGGSAANANLTFTIVGSAQLAGAYSASYASSAATTAGDMLISDAFYIDTEDQAKVLTFKFYYQAQTNPSNGNWSGTSSNSFGVAIYDVTSAAWIMPAGVWGMTQSSGIGYCTGTFQTTSSSTQYQIAVFNANASTNAITLYFDDFYVGPQTAPFGPVVTDWTAFTPTGAWVANSTYTGYWRRVGGDMEVQAKIALAGAPTSASLTVNLPSGYTIDTTRILSGADGFTEVGAGTARDAGVDSYLFYVRYTGSTTAVAAMNIATAGTTANSSALTQASPFTFGNGDSVEMRFIVPIVGWSSNVQMSNDTDTRVVAARMTGATATITGSYSDITWTTIANDTHGAMGAISYTVPVTGYYDIMGAIDVGATSLSAAGGFFIGLNNGSVILENKFIFDLNVPENESLDFMYGSVLLNAGATFKLQVKTTGTVGTPVINSSATTNFLAIKRLSGPAVVAATESVGMAFTDTSGVTLPTGFTNFVFATKVYDSHNAYAAGIYTVPVTGKYMANFQLSLGASLAGFGGGNQFHVQMLQNNATKMYTFANGNSNLVQFLAQANGVVSCLAGDTLSIQAKVPAGPFWAGLTLGVNYFSFTRVGN